MLSRAQCIQALTNGTMVIGQICVGPTYRSKYHRVISPFISKPIIVENLARCFENNIVGVVLHNQAVWGHSDRHDSKPRNPELCIAHYTSLTSKPWTCYDTGTRQPSGYIAYVFEQLPLMLKGQLFVKAMKPIPSTLCEVEEQTLAEHAWRIPESAIDEALSQTFAAIKPIDDRYPHVFVRCSTLDAETLKALRTHHVEVNVRLPWIRNTHPEGLVTQVLGKIGDLKSEHAQILRSLDLPTSVPDCGAVAPPETPEIALSMWPKSTSKPRVSGAEVYAQPDGLLREDVRHLDHMISIDPETAKDLDDALSVRFLDANQVLVGVHIADVSHYVKPESEIDTEARKRQTSVYLIGECIPMLPKILTEHVCSLNPGESKFTFSCYWTLDLKASIVRNQLVHIKPPFFVKTVTRSMCRLSYGQALEIIENETPDESAWSGLVDGFSRDEVRQSLLTLRSLHRCIRASRPYWVDLSREGSEMKFMTDSFGKVVGIGPYVITEAHKMIETFMVEANVEAGKLQNLIAGVIRTHTGFNPRRSELLEKAFKAIGIDVTLKSKRAFIDSLKRLSSEVRLSVIAAVTFALDQAKYVPHPDETEETPEPSPTRHTSKSKCLVGELALAKAMTGQSVSTLEEIQASLSSLDTHHYGLDVEIYTHFTSPIRRYPDILVHRNLEYYLRCELGLTESKVENPAEIKTDLENLLIEANLQKQKAAKAERQSQVLHLNLYLKSLPGPLESEGLVVNLQVRGANLYLQIALNAIGVMIDDVCLPLNPESRSSQPGIVHTSYDHGTFRGIIHWKSGIETPLHLLTKFRVQLVYSDAVPPITKIILIA